MKKKIIIPIIICLLLIMLVIGFIFMNREKTIMLDINPSLEIKVGFGNRIKKVIPVNDDAKILLSNDKLDGKDLNVALKKISSLVVEKGFIREGEETSILIYSDGINSNTLTRDLKNYFAKREVNVNVIVIKKISEEDKKLAKEYNISPSKASYINSIKKSNKKVEIKDLINNTITDLNVIEEKSLYCDDGYNLEGSVCVKELRRVDAISSMVCPSGSFEYNGVCYEDRPSKRGTKDVCHDNFNLVNGECVMEDTIESVPNCGENNYDSGQDKCIELVYVEDATEFCRDPNRYLYDNRCLATKPTINGGCLGSDALMGGKCVNLVDDYYMSEWKCSNGEVISNADGSLKYDDKKCYEKKFVDVKKYDCPKDYKLKGKKCELKKVEKPEKEKVCENGITMVDGRCINMNKTYKKVSGFVCQDDTARLEGNICIIYDVIGAKENN